jgi:hypothetical protein
MIFEQMLNKFSYENNNVYMFYKFHYKNCKIDNKTPLRFIDYLIDEYNNVKINYEEKGKEYPEYISEFINNMKNELIKYKKVRKEKYY